MLDRRRLVKSLEKDERSAKQPSDLGEKTRKMPSFLAWPPGLGSTLGTFAMIAFGHGKQVVSIITIAKYTQPTIIQTVTDI